MRISPNLARITAFVAMFLVMALELTAMRAVAPFLGSSIYTWTSVIGVVLAGMSAGNFLGGAFVDKYPNRAYVFLGAVFLISGAFCVFIPVINITIGNSPWVWGLDLIARVLLHAFCILMLPSIAMGTVTPLLTAKSIEAAAKTGNIIGSIYACSSIGSIVGVVAAGFFLIPSMGSRLLFMSIGCAMLLCGLLFAVVGARGLRSAKAVLAVAAVLSAVSIVSAQAVSARPMPAPHNMKVLLDKESPYYLIRVLQHQINPNVRALLLDHLTNTIVDMDAPFDLSSRHQYPYMRLNGALAEYQLARENEGRVLVSGGGGLVLPAAIAHHFPESRIDVVEIDPDVTEVAVQALGFRPDPRIRIFHQDSRLYLDALVRGQRESDAAERYTLIYGDAFNGFSVPYHLTTVEFTESVQRALSENGIYAATVIDIKNGQFVMAMLKTVQAVFDYAYLVAADDFSTGRDFYGMFTVIGANAPIDGGFFEEVEALGVRRVAVESFFDAAQFKRALVLRDDFAPVDQLIIPLVKARYRIDAAQRYARAAESAFRQKDFDRAAGLLSKALRLDPDNANTHVLLANVYLNQSRVDAAQTHVDRALQIRPSDPNALNSLTLIKLVQQGPEAAMRFLQETIAAVPDSAQLHYTLGALLISNALPLRAKPHLLRAVALLPEFPEAYLSLGNIYYGEGQIAKAREHYLLALQYNPRLEQARFNLATLLAEEGEYANSVYHYRLLLEQNPEHRAAYENLEQLLKEVHLTER